MVRNKIAPVVSRKKNTQNNETINVFYDMVLVMFNITHRVKSDQHYN